MSKINPAWVAHNNLNNEGGEGYNPHSKYPNESAESAEPAWSILEGKASKALRLLNMAPLGSAEYDARKAEHEAINAAYLAEFAAAKARVEG